MRSEINVIPRENIQRPQRTVHLLVSFTPGAAPGHFWKVQRDLIDHVNPPSSRDRLEGFWSDGEERRDEDAEEEEEEAGVERKGGSEKGGSQQKLN